MLKWNKTKMRSDRLKKLEAELQDLKQWLNLGLVPKKDIEKHKAEIFTIQSKLDEEQERLQFLKESGDVEEFVTPKRSPRAAASYTDTQALPEIDIAEETTGLTDAGLDMETDQTDADTSLTSAKDEGEVTEAVADEDDPFSDKNRWRRGIVDPDDDSW
jgi:hypothetical protein